MPTRVRKMILRTESSRLRRNRTEPLLSIRRFGDHPLLSLGATDIAIGCQYLPGWEPPSSDGPIYS